jgi:AhpD family alkylhydroperoxidase
MMAKKDYAKELMGYLDDNDKYKEEIPGPGKGFDVMYWAINNTGACPSKEKELMALAIAITMRCEGCMVQHTAGCLMAGASRDEIKDAISVATEMSGGPSFVFGAQVLDIVDQLLANDKFQQMMKQKQ